MHHKLFQFHLQCCCSLSTKLWRPFQLDWQEHHSPCQSCAQNYLSNVCRINPTVSLLKRKYLPLLCQSSPDRHHSITRITSWYCCGHHSHGDDHQVHNQDHQGAEHYLGICSEDSSVADMHNIHLQSSSSDPLQGTIANDDHIRLMLILPSEGVLASP